MLIDCNTCVMQHSDACDDCIVTILLDELGPGASERSRLNVNDCELEALDNLADSGLVPSLKLVRRNDVATGDGPAEHGPAGPVVSHPVAEPPPSPPSEPGDSRAS